MDISSELQWSIGINIVALAFFAGVYIHTIKTLEKNQETLEKNQEHSDEASEKRVNELKIYLIEKIDDIKKHFSNDLKRVEDKQDKHNNMIERTYALEKEQGIQAEQIKVINHRIQDLEKGK